MQFIKSLIRKIYTNYLFNLALSVPLRICEFVINKKIIFIPMSPKARISLWVTVTEHILRKNNSLDKKNKLFFVYNSSDDPPNKFLYDDLRKKATIIKLDSFKLKR